MPFSAISEAKEDVHVVYVFDFDHSVIDVNSDTWIVDELMGPELLQEHLPAFRATKGCWTFFMGVGAYVWAFDQTELTIAHT
jgi:hypothetical protein